MRRNSLGRTKRSSVPSFLNIIDISCFRLLRSWTTIPANKRRSTTPLTPPNTFLESFEYVVRLYNQLKKMFFSGEPANAIMGTVVSLVHVPHTYM